MFDKKTNAMLILGLLNDAYGDVKSIVYYLNDFRMSHPEMEEIKEFELNKIIEKTIELENLILDSMNRIKNEVYKEG